MDVNDINNCLILIEEALHSDIFNYTNSKIRTDRLINKLESKCKHKSVIKNNNIKNDTNSKKSHIVLNLSPSQNFESSSVSINNSETDSSIITNLSGNYSNIKPLTIGSELFKMSESYDVDSNSCYNMAFSHNDVDNTEIDAKIITYRK